MAAAEAAAKVASKAAAKLAAKSAPMYPAPRLLASAGNRRGLDSEGRLDVFNRAEEAVINGQGPTWPGVTLTIRGQDYLAVLWPHAEGRNFKLVLEPAEP